MNVSEGTIYPIQRTLHRLALSFLWMMVAFLYWNTRGFHTPVMNVIRIPNELGSGNMMEKSQLFLEIMSTIHTCLIGLMSKPKNTTSRL